MNWIIEHWVELIGALLGLVFVLLEIKQHILLWPVGIATSIFYIFVFFSARFYADMALQFYYVGVSIYGWFWWLRGSQKNNIEIPVTHIPPQIVLVLAVITLVLFVCMAFVLQTYTDSPVPVGDAFTTALSITATWMLARKYLEQWLVWIVVNGVSLGLYVYKELYPTSVLFFVYFILAFIGYYNWKRTLIQTKS